jgi:hypothetical protein
MVGKAAADGYHFAVRGRIVVGPSEIAPARNNLAVADDHGAERKVGLSGFIERHAHESFILARRVGCCNRSSGGQRGGGAERRHNGSPAVKGADGVGSVMIMMTSHW